MEELWSIISPYGSLHIAEYDSNAFAAMNSETERKRIQWKQQKAKSLWRFVFGRRIVEEKKVCACRGCLCRVEIKAECFGDENESFL